MKILFLHLSDMHIKDKGGYNQFQLDKAVDAIIGAGYVDRIVFILSGDLAYSGKQTEYVFVKKCVNYIISKLKGKAHHTAYIQICCVPGNHDVSFPAADEERLTSAKLQGIRKVCAYENHIDSQLKLQDDFFAYVKDHAHCDWGENRQFNRLFLNLDGFTLEVNMVNTGVFSSLDEDKGLHYISQRSINELLQPTGADFVISIMHHAPDWYTDDLKHQLEDVIYKKSSIVFLGHEHYIEQKSISHENNPVAIIQAGGSLCNNDDWQHSSFFVGILDTESYHYTQLEYVWNIGQRQYEIKAKKELVLQNKPSIEYRPQLKGNIIQDFVSDSKHSHLTNDFRDYFVFPRVQRQNSDDQIDNEIITENDFIDEILMKKRILLYGGYNLGKSTLLKRLFLDFSEGYIPVFCNIANIHGSNAERMIRNSFEDTYGSDPSDYERFQQMPKEKKIVIVDDADQISRDSFEPFLRYLSQVFEYVVMASKQVFDLDLVERTKSILDVEGSMYRYTILPFYADKREELIQKVVTLKATDKSTVKKTTQLLSNSISSLRRSIILTPDFIINYAEYYCNNIGEVSFSDSSVFSKVFEANITTSLSPYCKGSLTVEKVFTVFGKIAHCVHFEKAYPLPHRTFQNVIKKYNEDYGDSVSIKTVIDIALNSKLMIREENGDGEISYRFTNRNYLAYFVAREVNAAYNSDHDPSDLQKILRCACFGINADILLFISYITENVQILNTLLEMAKGLIDQWVEFDYDQNMPNYLKATTYQQIAPPKNGEYDIERRIEVESEKAEYNALKVADIYDYSDDAAEEMANQLIRACSLMIVIAKCLPGFEHLMKKHEKDAFVEMIYTMPNKIFGQWASMTDNVVGELIEFIQSQGQDYYQRTIPTSRDKILKAFQSASISLLLDMYNLASYYSTRENTNGYLSAFDYKARASYRVEHLMMLERSQRTGKFTDEALAIVEKSTIPALNLSVGYIVRHAIVFTREFPSAEIDKLSSKFFPNRESKAKLKAQRYLRPGAMKKE